MSLVFVLLCSNTNGQTITPKYNALIKKADTYYRLKNYKLSATTYSLAFKSIGWKAPVDDQYNAACAWSLAQIPDSAFSLLNTIATSYAYANYPQISNDNDLNPLHKDKRWKVLLEKVQQNLTQKEAKLNKPLIQQLDSIRKEDQEYRGRTNDIEVNYGIDSKEMKDLWKIIHEKDSINFTKVKAILDQYGWLGADVVGAEGNTTLFLVIQHADLKNQEVYLPMMREAVKTGKAQARELALLEDRVALEQGKKQIYGSQLIRNPRTGEDTLAPIEDFKNVDKRRLSVGLQPLDDYLKLLGIVTKKSETHQVVGTKKLMNSDFATALEIHDSIVGPTNVTGTFGSFKELNLLKKDSFYEETNSAWFKFTIDYDTLLTFDIVPEYPKDDFDFVLFKCSNPKCIDSIKSNPQKPDRWCFSVNYDKNGSTGLSEYISANYLGAGPGNGYVAALPVKAGETFYLMINWPYPLPTKGFTIYFYNYWPKKPKGFASVKSLNTTSKAPFVLENVLFENNSTILLKESLVVLTKFASILQKNKTMRIEVRGHSDNVGNEDDNQKLSEARAKAIVDYLVSKNVDKNRLSYKGLGSKQPIAPNDNEEGRKKNRRVEFVVLAQ